ncbi:hypothetical protein [Dactylosporangium sp. CA-092794]|uniref:hypothetical protein n=1 Tax=Dactylosporangium sp. CA-092794 TaxID=3239929 RepID=UPI003D942C38
MACAGRLPLRDEYLNAFARTVGLPVGDLAALLGLDVAEVPWAPTYPWRADVVEFAWAASRLDDAQLRAAMDYAEGRSRGTS